MRLPEDRGAQSKLYRLCPVELAKAIAVAGFTPLGLAQAKKSGFQRLMKSGGVGRSVGRHLVSTASRT